ncbi:hypothetical protein N658DRAFT_561109 [Parathielavia hyrcaniae]|uniref:F-box domain-containing protein n=1 Tax=Parathielavia hyrcaniae TaxID=113614 RepID=A0AAN6SZD2_9PEZI|nr:hypothetical protein N658DRAFT_561109 [Parathielavia hyrcaniae]
MAPSLVRLPDEILARICALVDQVHPPSLVALALGNRHLHSVATRILFEKLTFNITKPARLRDHVHQCTTVLRRYNAFRHVRCLVVVGFEDDEFDMHPTSTHNDQVSECDDVRWQHGPAQRHSFDWHVNYRLLIQGDADYPDFTWRARVDRAPLQAAYNTDSSWTPLAELALRMLAHDPAAMPDIADPHELALIASPTVHRTQTEALGRIITTEALVPNLCEPLGLQHLELSCANTPYRVTDVEVRHWTHLVNFSTLRVLRLTAPVDEQALDELLCQAPDLTDLTALTLHCVDMADACYYNKAKRLIRSLSHLERLSILGWDWSQVSLGDQADSSCGAAAKHSISKLRTLQCGNTELQSSMPTNPARYSITSASEITQLGALYPRIESLSLVVRRSKGDRDEVARYIALGASFPRLTRLSLTLDASPPAGISLGVPPGDGPTMPDPHEEADAFDDQYTAMRPYTNGHVMDVMVNSALDAKLARRVFEAIGSRTLETMMIRVRGGAAFAPHVVGPGYMPTGAMIGSALAPWLNGLAREWIVERPHVDGELKLTEIGRNAEGWKGAGHDPLKVHDQDPLMKHFRTLWPETGSGNRGWYDDWESWPLAGRAASRSVFDHVLVWALEMVHLDTVYHFSTTIRRSG